MGCGIRLCRGLSVCSLEMRAGCPWLEKRTLLLNFHLQMELFPVRSLASYQAPVFLCSVSGQHHAEQGGLRIYEAVSSPRRYSCIHSGAGKPERLWPGGRGAFRGREISHGGDAPKGAGCWPLFQDGDRISFFCPLCDLRDDPVGATGSGRLTRAQRWPAG